MKHILNGANESFRAKGLPTIAQGAIHQRGNFTVAIVYSEVDRSIVGVGFAKRNPEDSNNPQEGVEIALRRAISDYSEAVLDLISEVNRVQKALQAVLFGNADIAIVTLG